MKEFYNKGVGKCIILKEDSRSRVAEAIELACKKADGKCKIVVDGEEVFYFSEQFIVAHGFDKATCSWVNGHYYGDHLDEALADYNDKVKRTLEDPDKYIR